ELLARTRCSIPAAAPPARVHPPQAFPLRHLPGTEALARVRTATELWILVAVDSARGVVLVHHVDVGVGRHLGGEEAEDLPGVVERTGHHEVPHQEPADGEPATVEPERAHLAVHLADHPPGDVRVVLALAVAPGP